MSQYLDTAQNEELSIVLAHLLNVNSCLLYIINLMITSYSISSNDFMRITPDFHKNKNWKMESMYREDTEIYIYILSVHLQYVICIIIQNRYSTFYKILHINT